MSPFAAGHAKHVTSNDVLKHTLPRLPQAHILARSRGYG
jgi:hypothetical protein